MIKSIRIENADTSSHKVVVKTFDKGANGAPDVLVHTDRIDHPTAMATPSASTAAATWSSRKRRRP